MPCAENPELTKCPICREHIIRRVGMLRELPDASQLQVLENVPLGPRGPPASESADVGLAACNAARGVPGAVADGEGTVDHPVLVD